MEASDGTVTGGVIKIEDLHKRFGSLEVLKGMISTSAAARSSASSVLRVRARAPSYAA